MRYQVRAQKLLKKYSYLVITVWAAAVLVSATHEGLNYYKRQVIGQYGSITTQIGGISTAGSSRNPTNTSTPSTSQNTNDRTQSDASDNTSAYQPSSQTQPAGVSNASAPTTTSSQDTTPSNQSQAPSSSNQPGQQKPAISGCVLIVCVGL